MKTHYIHMKCSMDIIIPIGIYCYFDFDGIWKVAKFSFCQTQSVKEIPSRKRDRSLVNKRYLNMSKPTPRSIYCETLFTKHITLQRRIRGQRYNKICRCARKIVFSCDFLLGEIASSIRLLRGTQRYSACTLSGKTITEIPEYDSGLINKERTEYSTTSRDNRRILLGELTPSTWQVARYGESIGW